MVKAQATEFGETYHYCRQCKKELSEIFVAREVALEDPPTYPKHQFKDYVTMNPPAEKWKVVELPPWNTTPKPCGTTKNAAADEHFVNFPNNRCTCGHVYRDMLGNWTPTLTMSTAAQDSVDRVNKAAEEVIQIAKDMASKPRTVTIPKRLGWTKFR